MKFGYKHRIMAPSPDDNGGGGGDPDDKTKDKNNDPDLDGDDPEDEDDPDDDPQDVDKLPDWAQKQIKDLRKESAKNRTSNKSLNEKFEAMQKGMKQALGLEDADDVNPEEQVTKLSNANHNLEFQNAVLALAVEHGISNEKLDYFNFLMAKEVEGLEEDAELDDDAIKVVVQKVKGLNAKAADSSVDGEDEDNNPEGDSSLTLDGFVSLNVLEKSALYRKDPDTYNKFMAEAKRKKLI